MKFYSPTDFLKLPTANFVLENTGGHGSIGSPVPGMIVWDTGSSPPSFWIYTGIGWVSYLLSTTHLNEIAPPIGDVNMNFNLIHNLSPGVANGDAVNVSQLTAVSAGIDAKDSVRGRVTTPPGTWNGTQWTGTPVTLDGLTQAVGERFLVDLGTASSGIFVWAAGDILNRAPDMDTWPEVPGAFTFVEEGTSADKGYVSTANRGGTLNTTAIPWAQFSAATAYTAGAGLSLIGTDLSVNVDGVTIEIVTDALRVKDGGITSAKIADGTIVAADLADGAVTSVKIADGTIQAGDMAPGVIPAPPTSLPPNGPAGGDLTGTYPNPTIGPSKVLSSHILDDTILLADLNSTLKDGSLASKQVRSVGSTANDVAQGNHTHAGVARVYSIGSPALTANTWSANIGHNLNTPALVVDMYESGSGEKAILDWKVNGINAIQLRAGMAVAANAFTVTVMG